jgi:hypothetical protein
VASIERKSGERQTLLGARQNRSEAHDPSEEQEVRTLTKLCLAQTGEYFFDLGEIVPALVDLTERYDAMWREIDGRERLFPKPVKGGGIAFVFGNDVEENGAAVGVLLIA